MTPDPETPLVPIERPERRLRGPLALVLLAALAVRVWMALRHPLFYDDHYVFLNVQRFIDGIFTPRHAYYGTLSYLPQGLALALCDRLHAWTGIEALAVRGSYAEGFTLSSYRLMRMFIVAYGVASVGLAYRVGRRLFSPEVGLAAAAILAFYPQHIRSSIQLKPDMLTLLLTLLTLSWTWGAVRDPRLRTFLRTGVGVGLATSAKYYGAASCLPLTVWALVSGWRDRTRRRHWIWLPLAGLAALATFALLNPFPAMVLHNGQGVVGLYSRRARSVGSGHLDVFRKEIEFLAEQHGWVLGAFLLAGTVLLLVRLRRGKDQGERDAALLPLGLYLGYTVLHAVALRLFYPHNFMPVLAGTALVCAYGLVAAGRSLAAWPGFPRGRRALFAAGALLGAFLVVQPFAYAYQRLVPDTWSVAGKRLAPRLAAGSGRHLAYEPEDARIALPGGGDRSNRMAVPSLARVRPEILDLTDAEIFPLARLAAGPDAAFYAARRSRLGSECASEIHAEPFRLRGEALLLLIHPWVPAGEGEELGFGSNRGLGSLGAALPPDAASGAVYSFDLVRPPLGRQEPGKLGLRLGPGGPSLPLLVSWARPKRVRLLTPRFRLPPGVTEIEIPAPPRARPENYRLRLWRWTEAPCR